MKIVEDMSNHVHSTDQDVHHEGTDGSALHAGWSFWGWAVIWELQAGRCFISGCVNKIYLDIFRHTHT